MRVFTREQNAQFEWSYELRIIRMMVFWTVRTQICIAMRNLKGAIQMTVQRCFPVTHTSQIMQRNRCMNTLTSKLWFGCDDYVGFYTTTISDKFTHFLTYIISQMTHQPAWTCYNCTSWLFRVCLSVHSCVMPTWVCRWAIVEAELSCDQPLHMAFKTCGPSGVPVLCLTTELISAVFPAPQQ